MYSFPNPDLRKLCDPLGLWWKKSVDGILQQRVVGAFVGALALGLIAACGDGSGTTSTEAAGGPQGLPSEVREAGPMAGKNIVLVVVDTLRVDRLQIGGYHRETAPFLTSLAQQGVVFENAYSGSSWTAPAMASMFTSIYPDHHGVTTGLHFQLKDKAPDHEADSIGLNRIPKVKETLPEVLKQAGYRTFAVADNPNICEEMGFTRGFDFFDGGSYRGAPVVTNKVDQWSKEIAQGEAPYFLYVHYMDPHKPYHKSGLPYEDELGSYARELRIQSGLYDTEIRYVDRFFQRMFRGLNLDKNSLVIFVSDHGEQFGEHGGSGHGVKLHEELIRVPLMMVAFDESGDPVFEHTKVRKTTSTIDLLPTLRELLNLPSNEREEGVSLAPFLLGQAAPEEGDGRSVFSHRSGVQMGRDVVLHSVVEGNLKLIDNGGEMAPRLVDLIEDPLELVDLSAERPEDYKRMLKIFEDHLSRPRSVQREFSGTLELSEEDLAELGRLGYLDK